MEHTIKVQNKANGKEIEYAIHSVHLKQIKILEPFFDAKTPITIPWQVDGPFEEEAMAAMLGWVRRDSELKVPDVLIFRALAVLADQYNVPLLRDALSVPFLPSFQSSLSRC